MNFQMRERERERVCVCVTRDWEKEILFKWVVGKDTMGFRV
jgi:hypothetical protein